MDTEGKIRNLIEMIPAFMVYRNFHYNLYITLKIFFLKSPVKSSSQETQCDIYKSVFFDSSILSH